MAVQIMATPIRKQYLDVKHRYPDAIVLFRMGDFYETFDSDAEIAARDLEIVLTKRDMGGGEIVPLAGIPFHALENYLGRLIRKGHRVAICEQLSAPTKGRDIVQRDVVRVVTPGTILESSLLEQNTNNYLASLYTESDQVGIAYIDITTGEFNVAQFSIDLIPQELARLNPSEIISSSENHHSVENLQAHSLGAPITFMEPAIFSASNASSALIKLFNVISLEAFGCDSLPLAISAAGAIVEYLSRVNSSALSNLQTIHTYTLQEFMVLDPQTRRNLELFEGGRSASKTYSLLSVLDLTSTPVGARLLRRWIGQPLMQLEELQRRQTSVGWLFQNSALRRQIQDALSRVSDMERTLQRTAAGMSHPREILGIRDSLVQVPKIKSLLEKSSLEWLNIDIVPSDEIIKLISDAISDDPQGDIGNGGTLRPGYSADLDELREAAHDARSYIASLERREREKTGISTLKVGFNRVFGYYLEISSANNSKVPDHYVRRQTLANAERFYTPELKEHENRVLNARERIEKLEMELYREVCTRLMLSADVITNTARSLAVLDVLTSLAEVAARYNYICPELVEGDALEIIDGRHPVVEQNIPPGTFVPNNTDMACDKTQVMLLTGPNMAGKSTYIRQVAILVLMAQIGSFIPATKARIGLVDRIFTRVGLQDDLAAGQSTFMVEMLETASILNHATRSSLVVLDEIGRGTSTYDGLSIARAVAEYLHDSPSLGCRTLFATHFHELTELADRLDRISNYNVAVSDEDGDVIFLHRILPGGADRSYGVHVAKLAGLPPLVVRRAWEILGELEAPIEITSDKKYIKRSNGSKSSDAPVTSQLSLFQNAGGSSKALSKLSALQIETMTPIEAISMLHELQRIAEQEDGPGR